MNAARNTLCRSGLWLIGLVVILSGWLFGLSVRWDSTVFAAAPSFTAAIDGYFAVHQRLPANELISWDVGRELYVLQLGSEKSATVPLPASPYGGQMGYRAVSDRRYELWAVGPHGPILMSATEMYQDGG